MQYITQLSDFTYQGPCAVTLGKFDGMHRGHQRLIRTIRKYSDENTKSVVFAFDMKQFLLNKGITRKMLMTNEERKKHMEKYVDYLIECPFTEEFRKIEPEDFIKDILVDKLHAKYIVIGADYHFGRDKRGDANTLSRYAKKYGYHVDVITKKKSDDRIISSSYIRETLAGGDLELANELLGYPYTVYGKVEHGQKLGRTLGFPTMNIVPDIEKLLPKKGVYNCKVKIDGVWYRGIGNVGMKPTVTNDGRVLVEVHVLDYDAEAYEKEIEIKFLTFERGEKKFSSVEELKEQVDKDVASGKLYFEKA